MYDKEVLHKRQLWGKGLKPKQRNVLAWVKVHNHATA